MTDLQKAKMKRNIAVIDFLESNIKIIEKDASLFHFYEKLKKDQQTASETLDEILKNNVIQNHDKARLKKEVCTLASTLCEIATKTLTSLGKEGWYSDVKVWYLHFSKANDLVTEQRLRNAYNLLTEKSKDLLPKNISKKQLDELGKLINTFANMPGSSLQKDRIPPELTFEFKADLKRTETDILYIFEAADRYKDTHVDFYADLIALCDRPEEEEKTPTTLTVKITDSNTGLPLKNVAGTLDKSEETPISNSDGKLIYKKTKAGRGIASFSKAGYEENVTIIKIKASTANIFEITMNKL